MRTWEELYEAYELWQDPPNFEDELEVAAFVYPPETLLHDYDLPFDVCVALKNDAEALHYGRDILLTAIWALTEGGKKYPVGEKMRELVFIWANAALTVEDGRHSGRPDSFEKTWAVGDAYDRKKKENPQQKRDSIIKELEEEFGLKRRRILSMLAVVRDWKKDQAAISEDQSSQ